MKTLTQWFDERTGLVSSADDFLDRPRPGSPSWRYLLPSAITFAFALEVLTGLFLWMFYSANAQSAWESIFWLQEMTPGGWLLRGVHYFAGHLLVALVGLYLVQLVLTGMYRAPREFIFWVTLLLFFTSLGLMLTGDLLRWDQGGYWSTQVRTRFLTLLPGVGADAFKLAAGGPDFGHLTVTRFLALHGGFITIAFAALLALHAVLLRRHGLKRETQTPGFSVGRAWPGQAVLNFFGCTAVLILIGVLLLRNEFHGEHQGVPRGWYLGAELGAPADPAEAYAAARPEWAFLALYQFANLFPGEGIFGSNLSWKVVPIFVVPSLVVGLLFLMPLIALLRGRLAVPPFGYVGLGHVINLAFFVVLLGVLVGLSVACVRHDRENGEHQKALAAGHEEAQRVKFLARNLGIPPSGALTLLRDDPMTQGPRLFAQHCASCHSHADANGNGIVAKAVSAPNLHHFASRGWLTGLLDAKKIVSPDYFGATKFRKGKMADFVKETLSDMDSDQKKQLESAVMALSAEARLKEQQASDAKDSARIADGKKQLVGDFGCADCHKYHDKGQLGTGPDLTNYGSRDWIIGIMSNPAHKRFYGQNNDRMPAYAESADQPAKNLLSAKEIGLLADWLRGEWFEESR